MKLSDFDFELPTHSIATRPAFPRGDAKLLFYEYDCIEDSYVRDLCEYFRPGDRLVLNDTKVIPARLIGYRKRNSAQGPAHAKIEVTLLEPQSSGQWKALIKPLRKIMLGEKIVFQNGLTATCMEKIDGTALLNFSVQGDALDAEIDANGQMPLPPYIAAKRYADEQDKIDYQTVWAKYRGAVAAPTASLHLDDVILNALEKHGVEISYVTLHVGAGTFLPVKVDDIKLHKMHAEWGHVSLSTVSEINATKAVGGRIIAVGTTVLRLLEAASQPGFLAPFEGKTDIFIYPGFEFKVIDGLMTNFHLPKSTLLMLVAALIGKEKLDRIYKHAVRQNYRFFSYGDASLLFRK